MSLVRTRRACVLCGSPDTKVVMDLPKTPPANEFPVTAEDQDHFPLSLQLCPECGHLQLAHVVDPKRLFEKYLYVSGTSPVFVKHFTDLAADLYKRLDLNPESIVVDIGSNDGTLLKAWKNLGIKKIYGVEPDAKLAAASNSTTTNQVIYAFPGFFTRSLAQMFRSDHGGAALITANNVFAHADDLGEIAAAACDLLHPEGEFVFEVSYLRDIVEKMLFDTIYHEHLSYHSVSPLIGFLRRHNLHLYDVEQISTHGGSIRCFASRARKSPTQRMQDLVEVEKKNLFDPKTYIDFRGKINHMARKIRENVSRMKKDGYKICGFGAPAKLTTLMYTFGLNPRDFEFIVDDSPIKQGRLTPGMHIPIMPSSELYKHDDQRTVCVIFAWNFFEPILEKHRDWNGSWLHPLL